MKRKIRMGMVGGGEGAFIGEVHRMAARLDGSIELVCGAFSSDPRRASRSGRKLHLPRERVYDSFATMFRCERCRPPEDRMDFVAIVTPNHLHAPVALQALSAGFPVLCEKPLTVDLPQARQLARAVKKSGLLFGLTHNYTGYPLVKEARERVRRGRLGALRKIVVTYPQGWLATPLEQTQQKQAAWRTDPARAGLGGCMGDIGTHAANLAEYVTGLPIGWVCADLTRFIPGRRLDDDGNVLLRFQGGARGVLHASQVCPGEANGLSIQVYGEKGGLAWHQENPSHLVLKPIGRPQQTLVAGVNNPALSRMARKNCRLPAGHPEGFIEALANIYTCYAAALHNLHRGRPPKPEQLDFPGIEEGLRSMAFLDAVVRSSTNKVKWVRLRA